MENDSLSDDEVERLGTALSRLDDRMDDLKRYSGFSDEDLSLRLGASVMWDDLSLDQEAVYRTSTKVVL